MSGLTKAHSLKNYVRRVERGRKFTSLVKVITEDFLKKKTNQRLERRRSEKDMENALQKKQV